SLKKTR
ncbi:hypothetical protein SeMB42_g01910, partial [Synchytrium endobioticum]